MIFDDMYEVNDEIEENIQNSVPRRVFRDRLEPLAFYDDKHFRQRFRMNKDISIFIFEEIKEGIVLNYKNEENLPATQFLIA